jgi:hypothetical protein
LLAVSSFADAQARAIGDVGIGGSRAGVIIDRDQRSSGTAATARQVTNETNNEQRTTNSKQWDQRPANEQRTTNSEQRAASSE